MGPDTPGGQLLGRLNALSDASRLRMLSLLDRYELGVGELATAMQLPQSTASRHLRRLHEAGWVARRSQGVHARYRFAASDLEATPEEAIWTASAARLEEDPQAAEDRHRAETVIAERRVDSSDFFGFLGGTWTHLRDTLFGDGATTEAIFALLLPTTVVTDLGCGTGFVASQLAPWVARINAVDQASAMLDAARKRLAEFDNVEFYLGDACDPPLPAGESDIVLLTLLLHHIESPETVVQAAGSLLKPGGRLLIIDMVRHDRREYRDTMGHKHLGFATEDVDTWAHAAGLHTAHCRRLRPCPEAQGPGLFAAMLQRPTD